MGAEGAVPTAVVGSLGEEWERGVGKGRFCPQGDGRGGVAAVHWGRGRDGRRRKPELTRTRSPPSVGNPTGVEIAVRLSRRRGVGVWSPLGRSVLKETMEGEERIGVRDQGRSGGPPEWE